MVLVLSSNCLVVAFPSVLRRELVNLLSIIIVYLLRILYLFFTFPSGTLIQKIGSFGSFIWSSGLIFMAITLCPEIELGRSDRMAMNVEESCFGPMHESRSWT